MNPTATRIFVCALAIQTVTSVMAGTADQQKIEASNYAALMKPMDIYAPPPQAKRLISLKELYALSNTRGVALKVATESFNAAKETYNADLDHKKPVLTLDAGTSQQWTKSLTNSDPTSAFADRGSVIEGRSIAANGGFSLVGTPMQGLTYKLVFPQIAHAQTIPDQNTVDPERLDSGAYTISLDVSLLRDNPLMVEHLIRKKSNLALLSARVTLKQQALSFITSAEASFYGLAQKYLQLTVQERSFNLAKALERDVKEKIKAGESSALESTRAELQTAQAETDYMSSQIDYEAAVEEFRRSLAFDSADGDGIFPDPKALAANVEGMKIPETVQKDIYETNPDIQLAKISGTMAEIDMELARKATLPSLAFNTSYNNSAPANGLPSTLTETLRPNDRTFAVGLTYSHILYNDSSKSALQQAIVAKQKADFATDDAGRKVVRDINALIKRLGLGGRRYRIAKISREIAEKKLNSEYEKFRAGESSVRNVIDTQTEVNAARITEISAKVDMLLGFGQLNAIQGKLPEGVTLAR